MIDRFAHPRYQVLEDLFLGLKLQPKPRLKDSSRTDPCSCNKRASMEVGQRVEV